MIIDLDATSPLRNIDDIKGVLRMLEKNDKHTNIITGTKSRRSPYFNLVEVDKSGMVYLSGVYKIWRKMVISPQNDIEFAVNKINNLGQIVFVADEKNILIGTNVKIGSNCSIGHNTIIESNVVIGDNCSIGSNVIIRNTLIKNNVSILDGCVIGKKGFGFFPSKNRNIRYPHIGIVIIEDNCEIGCGSTIDRGSLSNTIIGKNTFIDNQVHIAHNNKIGENCIIAGQVGFAGSSILGNNVMIGGQVGISGHLKVGNNVQIGGGSGVIKDVPDNSKVMGYPAKDLKTFIKENKWYTKLQ